MTGTFLIPESAFLAYPSILRVLEAQGYCRVSYQVTSAEQKAAGLRAYEAYCTLWDKAGCTWEPHFREPVGGLAFLGWERVR